MSGEHSGFDGSMEWGRTERSAPPRYLLLLVGAVLLGGTVAAVGLINRDVTYTATGHLWIDSSSGAEDTGRTAQSGLARSGLAQSNAWIELFRSYQVLEPVVEERKLYLRGVDVRHPAFASFELTEAFRPGAYELLIDEGGAAFLLVTGEGALVQEGRVGEPIGASVGLSWTPPPGSLSPGTATAFSVSTVRDAAQELSGKLVTSMDQQGAFLRVGLSGEDPQRVIGVLNAVMARHVELAAELKRSKLGETLAILEEQLGAIERELASAERNLETFRLESSEPASRSAALSQTVEEERLVRRVRTAENLYDEIRMRVEAARLAYASATSDVRILDNAGLSPRKGRDAGLPLALAILFGCLLALVGGAVMVGRASARSDRSDGTQALRGIGSDLLPVLAIVVGCALAGLALGFAFLI